jgi:uncharacterized membrane protein HdeD (DUF308 family)
MRRLHLLIGSVGLLVFLGTGLYMRARFPELYGSDESLRYMYRASHVYLLFASLVNMVLGVYLIVPEPGWKTTIGRIGSMLALASPVVLGYAFFAETPLASPQRVFTVLGVFLAFLGVIAQLPNRRAPRSQGMPR